MSTPQNAQLGNSDHAASGVPSSINSGPTPSSTTAPTKRRHKPTNQQTMNSKPPKTTNPKTTNTTHPRTPTKKTNPTSEQKKAKRLLKLMQKTSKLNSRSELVFTAAHSTIAILQNHGISCAMFGSLACKLYGEFRHPKDVDVLVCQPPTVPPYSDEELKKLITNADPNHYYLKLPRNPEAPYRILYYHKDQLECKVDILTPGTMHLPNLLSPSSQSNNNTPTSSTTTTTPPPNHITTISNIPLIPFSLLLLHKLQGWSDHRSAPEQFKQHKQHQDAADIRRLLAMTNLIKPLQHTQPWANTDLFSQEFQTITKQRVKDYCKEFPMRAESWKLLGFETE